jgi:hypothetical protein
MSVICLRSVTLEFESTLVRILDLKPGFGY